MLIRSFARSPTQIEHDKWIQLNLGHSTLPLIAQWRLPFLFKNIWKIISMFILILINKLLFYFIYIL